MISKNAKLGHLASFQAYHVVQNRCDLVMLSSIAAQFAFKHITKT